MCKTVVADNNDTRYCIVYYDDIEAVSIIAYTDVILTCIKRAKERERIKERAGSYHYVAGETVVNR